MSMLISQQVGLLATSLNVANWSTRGLGPTHTPESDLLAVGTFAGVCGITFLHRFN